MWYIIRHTKTKRSRTRVHACTRHACTRHACTRADFFFGMYQLETRFARIIVSLCSLFFWLNLVINDQQQANEKTPNQNNTKTSPASRTRKITNKPAVLRPTKHYRIRRTQNKKRKRKDDLAALSSCASTIMLKTRDDEEKDGELLKIIRYRRIPYY